MFGVNPAKMAKNELMKIDLDKDGVPDVIEALDAAEAAIDSLQEMVKGFNPGEAANFLKLLNDCREPQNKKSPQEIHKIAESIVALPGLLQKAEDLLNSAEKHLKE